MTSQQFIVTLSCADQPGIVHAVSGALLEAGCNITESQQFESPESGSFFMRVAVSTEAGQEQVQSRLDAVAARFAMELAVHAEARPLRTLIMCSTAGHALNDLLYQQRAGSLPIEVPLIVSNHRDLAPMAEFYGVDFLHLPVTPATKADAEARLLELVEHHDIELVVLARYMQILSDELCRGLSGRAINIHHSFLPSFKGARPYHQAHARGVKMIGATAHFVTADLDEGPIIEQQVIRVNHSQTPSQFVAMGRSVEGSTLAQAVQWAAQRRILLDGRRTVVFN
ncbi:MAG: formyltetrahydrofolate deformylase [Arthrobacter sp.]|uniref:formyltetrahydrofolate deformylase n=1 Tax=unclassified Arthrobacter TaxID=235627 RepID=UPI0026520AB6|nr:formyltetrahydrofolate deformylase [Micrococcaceae bacterium]MDN5811444.1 formyltetrahydrofolate deformylase [Micrococcaceae bacterium]MDN5824284.1 formyltetrahydrofolate deformylase [Micrococcaceae bacterium]MDN5879026.1 formyltetrahydrofolate deformylase [Micrococcaceae bacterium]MDN5885798.1 formyltetrahydrofolate deformylase [Micrococcaceae bacterium]